MRPSAEREIALTPTLILAALQIEIREIMLK
jgi:hypothetical protein